MINKLVTETLANANRVEIELMRKGDLSVAVWLVSKMADLTAGQNEAVAYRVMEAANNICQN